LSFLPYNFFPYLLYTYNLMLMLLSYTSCWVCIFEQTNTYKNNLCQGLIKRQKKMRLLTRKELVMISSKVKKAIYDYINMSIKKQMKTSSRSISIRKNIDNDQIHLQKWISFMLVEANHHLTQVSLSIIYHYEK